MLVPFTCEGPHTCWLPIEKQKLMGQTWLSAGCHVEAQAIHLNITPLNPLVEEIRHFPLGFQACGEKWRKKTSRKKSLVEE